MKVKINKAKNRKARPNIEHLEVHGSCTVETWLGEF